MVLSFPRAKGGTYLLYTIWPGWSRGEIGALAGGPLLRAGGARRGEESCLSPDFWIIGTPPQNTIPCSTNHPFLARPVDRHPAKQARLARLVLQKSANSRLNCHSLKVPKFAVAVRLFDDCPIPSGPTRAATGHGRRDVSVPRGPGFDLAKQPAEDNELLYTQERQPSQASKSATRPEGRAGKWAFAGDAMPGRNRVSILAGGGDAGRQVGPSTRGIGVSRVRRTCGRVWLRFFAVRRLWNLELGGDDCRAREEWSTIRVIARPPATRRPDGTSGAGDRSAVARLGFDSRPLCFIPRCEREPLHPAQALSPLPLCARPPTDRQLIVDRRTH